MCALNKQCEKGYFSDDGLTCHLPMLESSSTKRYSMAAFSLLCLLATLCILVLVRKNRHFSIIRAAAPNFLSLMCIGAILLLLMPSLMVSYPPSKAQCVARLWIGFTGFTVLFTALFAKTFRIALIFDTKVIHRVAMPDNYLIKLFGGFIGVLWTYLIAWTIVDPPVPTIFASVVRPNPSHISAVFSRQCFVVLVFLLCM